jgi:F-type H+-transporting ATPase subunit a
VSFLLASASHDPADHVLPHAFFQLLPFNFNFGFDAIPLLGIPTGSKQFMFTNHLLMTLVAAGLCWLTLSLVAKRYTRSGEPKAPTGIANFFEAILQFIRESVVRPILGRRTDEYISFLWTLFFFILYCNLLGMMPLDAVIGFTGIKHVGGTATGNLAVTGGLAICAFFMIHFGGAREVYRSLIDGTYGHHHHDEDEHADDHGDHGHADHGHGATTPPGKAMAIALPLYLWNFAPHVFAPGPDAGPLGKLLLTVADIGMWAFLLVLEMIGAVIKPFALMIRLFANMVAGHIVLASILGLTFVAGSYLVGIASAFGQLAISCLELFVAFLQAYIFTFLTALFIGSAVAPEH